MFPSPLAGRLAGTGQEGPHGSGASQEEAGRGPEAGPGDADGHGERHTAAGREAEKVF